MRLRHKQRGFLLNPYRFAGSTQQGAFVVSGESSKTMAGAAVASTRLVSASDSSMVMTNGQASAGAVSVAAESAATLAGASLVEGGASVIASAAAAFEAPAPEITVDAADFDGTNDYMARGGNPTGIADGKTGTLSLWARIDADAASMGFLFAGTGAFVPRLACQWSASRMNLQCRDAASNIILLVQSSASYPVGSSWVNVLASWDLSIGARHFYVNDVSDKAGFDSGSDAEIDYTTTNWFIGANFPTSALMNGALAEVFFHTSYIDLSQEANRRKFISASGKPVDLGSVGSIPLGVTPLIYQHLADGESASNFAINRGTGGNFTVTGSLDTASSSPSD